MISGKKVIYPSKNKFLVFCVLSLLMWSIMFTISIIVLINADKSVGYIILGFATFIPIFYIFMFYKVYIYPKPIMTINAEGLLIPFYGMIYWIEIENLCLQCFRQYVLLEVILKDKEAVLSRLSPMKRFFVKVKVFWNHPPVSFDITFLPMSTEQLSLEMGKFCEAASGWIQKNLKETAFLWGGIEWD